MSSKKPLKGFHGAWVDKIWTIEVDNSFYVDHTAKRKRFAANGKTQPWNVYGRGATRQLGAARIRYSSGSPAGMEHPDQFVIYAHSQITDGPYGDGPASTLIMDREDTEKLVANLLRALME